MRHVDLPLVGGEAHREPFLLLAAVLALPRLADDLAGNVVAQPLVDRAEARDRADVGLLVELAQPARIRILAGIEPALRHLPGICCVDVLRAVDAPPDEHEALAPD